MRGQKRVLHEPAYVLHQHDFSETSLILQTFTRHYGRISLLAKGVKRPLSSFRAVLLPLQAVLLGFGYGSPTEADQLPLATLQKVEWSGHWPMPSGPALLAGYYLNELVLKMLAKDDPHPSLFDDYHHVVQALAQPKPQPAALVLRAFELQLLQATGYLPSLAHEAQTRQALNPLQHYALQAERGLVAVAPADDTQQGLAAPHWQALQQALDQRQSERLPLLLQAIAALDKSGQRQLRLQLGEVIASSLAQHPAPGLGHNTQVLPSPLQTRRFMAQLQNL